MEQRRGNVIPPDAALIFDVEVLGIDKVRKSISDEMLGIILKKMLMKPLKDIIMKPRKILLTNII